MRILKSCLLFVSLMSISIATFALSPEQSVDFVKLKIHANNLTGISCDTTAQRCLAAGFIAKSDQINHVVYRTQDGGRTWSKPITLFHSVKLPVELDSVDAKMMKISCDDAGMLCHAAGSMRQHTKEYIVVATTYDGGVIWTQQKFLRKEYPVSFVIGLACGTSGERCVLLGANYSDSSAFVYTTADMGQTWSEAHNLPVSEDKTEVDKIEDISCSDSGLVCTIVGGMETLDTAHAISFVTNDGGISWTKPLILDELSSSQTANTNSPVLGVFSHVRCDNLGTTCIALRHLEIPQNSVMLTTFDVYRSVNRGLTWERIGTLDNSDGLLYEPIHAFDCSGDLQTCVAVHAPTGVAHSKPYVYTTHDSGINWTYSKLKTPKRDVAFMDLFCDDNAVICQMVGLTL